jgi:hypothetical protein
MKASELSRELRRIARREVPNGEPNLWPTIRQQLERAGAGGSSLHQHGEARRSGADLSSSYVWHADAPKRRRFGTLPAALAAGLTLALFVTVLAIALGNQGGNGDQRFAGSGRATPMSDPAAGLSTPHVDTLLTWPSNGSLTLRVIPAGFIIGGTINAQILPSGNVHINYSAESARDVLIWHVVSVSCKARQFDGYDIVPPFVQPGGSTVVPAEKTHQPMNMVGFTQQDNRPVICASIPAVPSGFVASYAPAEVVPHTCLVTLPSQPFFIPPAGQPADPVEGDGDYWYGTNDLWTALPLDGVWPGDQKVFWWSPSYNVNTEPLPALKVTGKRLDGNAPLATADRATSGAGVMLDVIRFPTSGCWQITGAYHGHSLSFVVWVDQVASPVTPTTTPIPTTAETPIPSQAACPAEPALTRFIAAFNANDQATLTAMLPEQSVNGESWLATVTTGSGDMTGDTIIYTRDAFLAFATSRHQQHEILGIMNDPRIETGWLPGDALVTVDLSRQADDLPNQQLRASAQISCDTQQIDSWSIGAIPSTASPTPATGDALTKETLRARPLHLNDIALSGGTCPVDQPHTVDPNLSPALGKGPLYVVMPEADKNGVNHMDSNNGWDYFKVLWTSDPSYQGPVLVRGMQIDGSGEMRFGDNNPPDPELYFTAPHYDPVTYTRVNAPGCYAYQVDGINFSELIVTSFQP